MLHIIILNNGYFPEKLNTKNNGKDRVVVIASPSGSIPVSAYQDDMFKNIEVKLIPEVKESSSKEGKELLRITQALYIGELIATNPEFELYSDDAVLLRAISPNNSVKNTKAKKASVKKASTPKSATAKTAKKSVAKKEEVVPEPAEAEPASQKEEAVVEAKAVTEEKTKKTSVKTSEKKAKKTPAPAKAKAPKKAETAAKAPKKEKAAKLPTAAQVKGVLGASNSGYSKIVVETLKKSNQITFEMNMRMRLAETGLDAGRCQELAKNLNDEFGKVLPMA